MAKRYGCAYMGSKNAIAEDVIAFLPKGDRLVDLFGGGGAISHCALSLRKYPRVLYNELDTLAFDYVRKAFSGGYKDEKRWISREDFFKLKDVDGYVRYCWSFGNNGRAYIYSKEIEPWKRALHYARVFNDTSLLKEFGIESDGSRKDITKNKEEYRRKYISWFSKNVSSTSKSLERLQGLESLQRLQGLQGLQSLERLQYSNASYDAYNHESGDVVYCDIPYEKTEKYNKRDFDHSAFYDWAASRDFPVFISSYNISDNRFVSVWEKEKLVLLCATDNTIKRAERIYVQAEYADKFKMREIQLDLFDM